MLVKTIIDNETGHKTEIIKRGTDQYDIKRYEYYTACGWRLLGTDTGYTRDCIEWLYDVILA